MATSTVLGTCHHDCPDSCGWVVTVEDGVAVKMRGNPAHPYSRGELCPKVNRYLDRVYSPERLLQPLRRNGPKGSGQFEPVSWDEALTLIAERVHAAVGRHGAETVLPYSSAGNQSALSIGSLSERFFTRMGASRLTGSVCGAVAREGYAATTGTGKGMDPMDLRHSRLIILWANNTLVTNRHLWPFIEEARAEGAQVVVIDPLRTATAERADWFVQPLPGTDAALALGMMHVIIRDGLVDHDYVQRYTTGYEALALRAKEWTPERTAEVTGLTPDDVERLAMLYGTVRPAAIRALIGAEHREHGAMLYRTIACLPALVGAWRHRGGGFARSTSAWFDHAVDSAKLAHLDHPLAVRRSINVNHMARALTDPTLSPPITVLFAWNGNPLVTQPNSELFRRGLERDDLFTVVHEQFLTDTARYADVVLPATTQIEQLDVVPAWGHLYLGWNAPAIAPRGESVSNTELFRRLARAMGYTEPELQHSDEELMAQALHRLSDIDRAALRADGFVRLDLPEDLRPFVTGGFGTASGLLEFESDALARAGHDPLPAYEAASTAAALPGGGPDDPLVLLTMKLHRRFLNSSYSHLHARFEGEPFVELHPDDANGRGLADGARVRVWNERGSLTVRVRRSTRVRPGVAALPFGWWGSADEHGGVANSLTSDTLTDWGGGVAYHDTVVRVSAV